MVKRFFVGMLLIGSCLCSEPALNTKGFDVCGMYAGEVEDIDYKIELAKKLGLNALVINVKNDNGILNIDLDDKQCQGDKNKLMKEVLKKCRENGIYTIARVVCFADNVAPVKDPDMAIKERDETLFVCNNSLWLNPYSFNTLNFITNIVTASAKIGFDEVRLDFLRFTEQVKRLAKTNISLYEAIENKADVIERYLNILQSKLKRFGTVLSLDVIAGIIPGALIKEGITELGQNYKSIARKINYVCPMVYPSHWHNGALGVSYPDLDPYTIVKRAISCSNNALKKNYRKVSPWIQGFTANWLPKGQYRKYGRQEIQDQIDALRDCGIKSFCIWNMSLNYDDVLSNTGGGGAVKVWRILDSAQFKMYL